MSSYKQLVLLSGAGLVLAVTKYYLSWYDILWWLSLVVAFTWSLILATYSKFSNSKRIYPKIETDRKSFYPLKDKCKEKTQTLKDASHQGAPVGVPVGLQPIISELVELILRDFVLSWYQDLVQHEPQAFIDRARIDIDHICAALCQMLSTVDYLLFITEDIPQVLNNHLSQVQLASTAVQPAESVEAFVLHECASSDMRQREHLTVLSTLICDKVLPPNIDSVTRKLAIGVFTTQVLEPAVVSMTNPDSINQSLLSYLQSQEELLSNYRSPFTYAASYEDFVGMIIKCVDVEELKQMRYHIITEIMHSTTLQGLKKSDEPDAASNLSHGRAKIVNKVEMLRGRDLKRYANQLRIAKTKCEKRISRLGGEEYAEYCTEDQSSNQHRGHKVISFKLTMHNLSCRGCFHGFLKSDDCESLLEYWVAAETLKSCDISDRHRLASEIYSKYIASSVSIIRLEKPVLKGMEAFLMGNRGAESFYEAQDIVYHQLEENHYPQFLVSEVYHHFIIKWDSSESTNSGEVNSYGSTEDYEDDFQDIDDSDLVDIQNTQSEYNKKKIADIDERIFNKTQAHQVISSQHADSKYSTVLTELEKELEALKLERRGLEAHQEQVDAWWKHIGQWSATVVQHELVEESGGWRAYYLILIRLQDQVLASPTQRNGWVVSRTLQQIKELQHDLCQIDENLHQLHLPSKVRIGRPSDDYINKSKAMISAFLQWVIHDKTLSQSSELFHFVSTHPHLNTESVRKSTRFSVPRIFKRKQETGDSNSADLLFYNTTDDSEKQLRGKDSIAGPLYALISEIFELKGASKLLRKTMIQLVQVTYGKSINRQIRETVGWLTSEPMLVYYLKFWKGFFWPGGDLAPTSPVRDDEAQAKTRSEAKSALIRNIPDPVIRLFGDKAAKLGLSKLYDTFQDQTLNRHFLYMLLSRFTDRLLPEVTAAKRSKGKRELLADWTMPTYTPPNMDDNISTTDTVLSYQPKQSLGERSISRESTNQASADDRKNYLSNQKPVEYRRFVPYK